MNDTTKYPGLATYLGFQPGYPELQIPGIHLWDLLIDIPGHPEGSTVSETTLDRYVESRRALATRTKCVTLSVSMNIREGIEARIAECKAALAAVK